MTSVSLHEAKTHLSALISLIERNGEKVIILRHGVAVAELVPLPRGSRTRVHAELKDIKIKYDPVEPTEAEWNDV